VGKNLTRGRDDSRAPYCQGWGQKKKQPKPLHSCESFLSSGVGEATAITRNVLGGGGKGRVLTDISPGKGPERRGEDGGQTLTAHLGGNWEWLKEGTAVSEKKNGR